MIANNERRTERKRASANVIVTDVISGRVIGHLGDLSSNGMLLISKQSPRSEGLYQVSMTLPASSRTPPSSIEVGIQEQWHEPATTSGQIWAGYRIVAISDADAAKVGSWLAHA